MTDHVTDEFLQTLAVRNEWMTYREADFESEEGRSIPYVVLSSARDSQTSCGKGDKLRVWVQGSHHGNEPSGDEATLAFLGALDANQTWAEELLEKLDITVLPRYNPDGVFYFQRELASNYDPNRDHIQLRRQQTIDHKKLYNDFDAHVAIDLHELSAPNVFGQRYQHGADGFYAPGKHPLTHQLVRDLSEGIFTENIINEYETYNIRPETYATKQSGNDTDILLFEAPAEARLASNAWGLSQAISFLIETRGIGLADQNFQRRVVAAFLAIKSIVQTATDNKDEIQTTLKKATKDFIDSKEDIIVTFQAEAGVRNYTFVSRETGEIVYEPVKFRSSTNLQANFTRSRPEGYLIPKPWASIAEKLTTLGVKVEKLDEAWEGEVESLKVTSVSFADGYYEGALLATTSTEASKRAIRVPRGSFYVSTRQKNAALAFVALEPESVDSFVTHAQIPLRKGDEYPIFRVL